MKKKLNFFCILLLVLMVASVVMECLAGAEDFRQGWEEGAKSTEVPAYFGVLAVAVSLVSVVAYVYAFACFVRFILNVNRGEVFIWDNVDLLRTVGWCVVVTTIVLYSVMSPDLDNLLESLSKAIGIIIEGVFILIMAEAFSIGLKLQEEQNLTI